MNSLDTCFAVGALGRRGVLAAAPALLALLAGGCGADMSGAQRAAQPPPDLVRAIGSDSGMDRFAGMLARANLLDGLRAPGPFTVFGPSNGAINWLPGGLQQDLLGQGGSSPDMARLQAFLNNHIVEGNFPPDSFAGKVTELRTRNGTNLRVDGRTPGRIAVQSTGGRGLGAGGVSAMPDGRVEQGVAASNGYLYRVSWPLMP
ncbi:MAG: fasciclin domain-containing protein [Alphaproteobacteria bacterium]|nr:fasciclin domain-containing protein [Alphaproteobacteria bacterium]